MRTNNTTGLYQDKHVTIIK